MASLRKLLFILFIIFLNLLLGINCAIIGMISPIGELIFQSQSQVRSGDVELIVRFSSFFMIHLHSQRLSRNGDAITPNSD